MNYFFLISLVTLGNSKDHYSWWDWKIKCFYFSSLTNGLDAIFCHIVSASCIGSKVCHFSRCAKCYATIPICISWSAGNLMTSHSNINIRGRMSSKNLRPVLLNLPSCHYNENSAGSNIIMIINSYNLEHQIKRLWE